jgi:hypothetical protein
MGESMSKGALDSAGNPIKYDSNAISKDLIKLFDTQTQIGIALGNNDKKKVQKYARDYLNQVDQFKKSNPNSSSPSPSPTEIATLDLFKSLAQPDKSVIKTASDKLNQNKSQFVNQPITTGNTPAPSGVNAPAPIQPLNQSTNLNQTNNADTNVGPPQDLSFNVQKISDPITIGGAKKNKKPSKRTSKKSSKIKAGSKRTSKRNYKKFGC